MKSNVTGRKQRSPGFTSTGAVRGWLSVPASLVIAACQADQPAPERELVVTEESAATLSQDGIRALGVVARDDGTISFWTDTMVYLGTEGQAFRPLTEIGSVRPMAVGLGENGLSMEVFDRDSRLISLDEGGVQIRDVERPVSDSIEAAIRWGGRWVVASREETGVVALASVRLPDQPADKHPFAAKVFSGSRRVLLSAPNENELLLTETDVPYATLVYNSSGEVEKEFRPLEPIQMLGYGPENVPPLWYAMSPLRLDEGYVQTVSDLRTSRRALVLYDEEGSVIRVSEVNAPIGFVAALPSEKVVFALRMLGQQELVRYRWSWVP
jgi:hypothetical protein